MTDQVKSPRLNIRNTASARPRNDIQRGRIPVRNASVDVEIIKTPAIFIA